MAHLKSRYKPQKFRDGGAVPHSAAVGVDVSPTEGGIVTVEPLRDDDSGDDAAHLSGQIDALRKAEAHAAAQQAPAPQAHPAGSHEETLAAWRSQGMGQDQERFLRENPQMITRGDITAKAFADAVNSGFPPDHPHHFAAVRGAFNKLAEAEEARQLMSAQPVRAEPSAPATEAALSIANKYSTAGNGDELMELGRLAEGQHNREARRFSAPVSRDIPTAGYRPIEDRSVTLSPAQKEAAKLSGVSEQDYALGLLEMRRRKRDGELQ